MACPSVPTPCRPSPIPLTQDEGLGGVTNIHPHLTAGPVPAALTAAPPPAAAADAARLLPSVALAPTGPAERSHPLPSPPIPLTQDEGLGGVTNIHPHLTAGPVPAALTAAPPPAAAADAARLLPSVALAPTGPAERSHPLPSSPIPLTQDEGLGGVTNIHPHLTAGPVPAALTAAPPLAAAADAARLLPSVALAPTGPAERSHPLPSPPIPLTQDESLGGVTNIHLPVTAGPVPAALTAAPPLAAAADAARLLPSVALAPGGPTERSHPLPSSPTPLTQDDGSGGVTNVHPPLTAGPVPAAPTAAPPLTAVDDAARPLPAVPLASVSPYESSYPLPQSLLPLSAPPSTGDGWRCRCRPHQDWQDRRRCGECGRLWCAACTASQCRCEPEFFRWCESDATHAQPRDHSACVVSPSPRPPVPDAPEDPSRAENVAVPHAIAISPLSRPINGGMVQVRKSLILPENASARTDRGCTSAPVAQGGEGGHATVRDHAPKADAGDDDEKRPAFSQSRVDLSESPGGRPDLSAQSQTKSASLDVTYVHGPPSGTPPASPPSSPPGSPVDTPEELLARSGGASGILLSDRVLPESMPALPPPSPAAPTPLETLRDAAYAHPPANASRPAGGSLFGPPVAPPGVSLFGPPAASAGVSLFRPPADPVVPGAPAASPSSAPPELPQKPLRPRRAADALPPSEALNRSESFVGVTNVHPQDVPPALRADPAVTAASTSQLPSALSRLGDQKGRLELPERPRRSFGPPSRAASLSDPAGARPASVPPTAPAGLAGIPATTPDDLLEVLASNKKASQAELPAKPTREQPTQPSLPDAEALQLVAQKKEAVRLAKNAKARAKTAMERAAAEEPGAKEDVVEEPRELTQHLLGEFDKASTPAEVESTFTKQVAGIPAAIRTKVASGRVSIPLTEASSPHDSAGDDESSDGLSEVGGETFEPYEPTVGDYVQIKMTSASSFKGLVMQIHRVKGTLCTLRQIGAANVPGSKRPAVDSKSLHDIQRTGVTADIHRNPANLQDYVNLRVENPTLPEAPPPTESETSIPPTPSTVVPEPKQLLLHSGVGRTSYLPAPAEVQATLPLTAVYGLASNRPLRRPASLPSAAAACSTTPKPRDSSSSTSRISFCSAESQPSTSSPRLPESTIHGPFAGAAASTSRTATKIQHPARTSSASSVPKYPPGKRAPPTTVDPRDPLFEPPTEGIAHYHDASGGVHVITAPGVSVPSTYNSVDVKTSEQAVTLHEAAQAATAAAVEAAAAQSLLEERAATSSPAINAVLLSEKEQFVLPKSLRTPASQILAVKMMKALHLQVDCAKRQALANKQEIDDLLNQIQELYNERGLLVDERDTLAQTAAELVAEQSRLQLELQRQLPEASATHEEAVTEWKMRCEQLQEQLDVSTAAATVSDERARDLQAEHRRALASAEGDRLEGLRNWSNALDSNRGDMSRLQEAEVQLSQQLTEAEHQLQLQGEQIDELQAEHQRELASVEEDRLKDESDWTDALNEAEAKEAIAITEANDAEQECEEHKAKLLQQLKEAQAAAEVLEARLREFDEFSAAAAVAAEAEHNRDRADLQRQVDLQSARLKKSDQEQRAILVKLEEAEDCLRDQEELLTQHEDRFREQERALNTSVEELATAREEYATSTDEKTRRIDRLLLFTEQLEKSVAAASRESDQKKGEHHSVVSALEQQMAQLRLARSSAEEQRATASEELDSLRQDSGVAERRLQQLQAHQVHLQATCAAECAQVREAAHASRVELQSECARLQAECEQLRGAARPCTTCGGGGGQDPEDDCPAELAATREKLQLAEDYITDLGVAYDTLRDLTLVKLAERDAKVASAMSTLALRDSDLTSAQATISARNSDLTAIHASLTSRDAELAALHPQLAQLRVAASSAEELHASHLVTMSQLRTAAALAETEWRDCHSKQMELQDTLQQQHVESARVSELIRGHNLWDLFYTPQHLRDQGVSPSDPDVRGNDNRRVAFSSVADTPQGRVNLLDQLPGGLSHRPPHTTTASLAAALALAAAQQSNSRPTTPTPPADESEGRRAPVRTPPSSRPVLTSGSSTVGFTEEEGIIILVACAGHQLKPDVELCLKSKPDNNLGKTPHRLSFKRFVSHEGVDRRTAAIMIGDLASGKVKLFTDRLAISNTAGWDRGAEWRGSGPGSRNNAQSKLNNIILNGGTWGNILHAMDCQVRSHAKAVNTLQNSLIRVVELIAVFADQLYDEATWPINFLMEMMFFMFDTTIAGPSQGASQDAKRNLEAAVPSGDIVSTARLYEQLFLATKDPTGEKRMTYQDFYNDPTCVEEIHEGFVRIYLPSSEHRLLMVDLHADFDDRRRTKEEHCGSDPRRIHEYLSICNVADKYRAKEASNRTINQSLPQNSTRRKESVAELGTQQRVAVVDEMQTSANDEIAMRVAALESQHFRNGGPFGGGTPPPPHGSLASGSTAAGGMMAKMRNLQPVKSPPSQSGSESDSFIGKDGLKRHNSKGQPEVRITEAVEALKDKFLPSVLSLRYVKIPPGVDAWEHLSRCRLDPWMVERLYDGGNCSSAVKEALAYISPAEPYGASGEPEYPSYSPEIKRMQKNPDGSESWAKDSCLCCAHAPPWNTKWGPPPAFNTPEALMYRNGVSSEHNPHPCPARLLAALMTDCQPLIECIVLKPAPKTN